MPQSNEEESNQSGNLPERVISENTESDSGADLENQGVRNRKTTKLGDSDSDKDMEGHHCNVCKIWVKKRRLTVTIATFVLKDLITTVCSIANVLGQAIFSTSML